MKKILTALLCALGFSLVSQADPKRINGTNFEDLPVGTNVVGYADTSLISGDYWSWTNNTMAGVAVIVTNETEQYDAGEYGFPAIHGSGANEQHLYLQTKGSPLVRRVDTDDQKIDQTYGFYFDSLVQFTATDSLASKSNEDKLIVWLREQGGETNLVVTAGYLNDEYGSAVQKDYVVSNVAVESDKWYRLTIEAKTDIFEANDSASFVVYVDGKRAEYSTDEAAFDSLWKVKEKYSYLYTDNCHAVFPSMVQGGDNKAKIASVAFEGVGRIDDIEFTTVAPDFITAVPASLTVTWTNGVDTLTITPRPEGDPIEIAANGAPGSTNLAAGVYTIDATVQSGYVAAGLPDGEVDASSSVVIVNVTTSPEQATVNGKAYGSLKDAFNAAAAGDGTAVVRLTLDQEIAAADGIAIAGENGFVLDLAGKNIVVTPDSKADGAINIGIGVTKADGGAINIGVPLLTLIDSVGGGAITNTEDVTTLFVKGGELVIGRADGDEGATVYGSIAPDNEETISIVKGFFSEEPDSKYVAKGYKSIKEEGESLWEVVPDVPVENHVAKIGDQGYETLAAAIAAAGSSDTVTLLADITLDDWILVEKAFTLDLNGHTLSKGENWTNATPAHDALVAIKHGGSLTINDSVGTGVIDASELFVGVKMTIAGDTADENPAVLVVNAGTIKGKNYGISGNGTTGRGNTSVTINGGTILAVDPTGDSCGIFNPQAGTLTIAGGHIEGGQGIWMKSGTCTCTVNAGTIVGTAPKAAYVTSKNGFNSTGDAFVVDNVGYVGGAPVPSIAGGTFVSSNSTAVASYANSTNEPIEGFVAGGTFNTPLATEYCKTSFIPADNGNGTYGVELGWKIAFVNDDDTLIYATNVQANATVEYLGETPTKAADAEYTYTFKGWTPALAAATADATYKATFTPTPVAAEDWAEDTKDVEGKTASQAYPSITGDLAEVDAAKLTVWAKENNVAFADASNIKPEAYALNCANTDEAIATAKGAFDIQSITVDSEGNVTVTAPEALTGEFNGTLQLKGSNNLKDWSDTDTTSGYQFFYYELNLK